MTRFISLPSSQGLMLYVALIMGSCVAGCAQGPWEQASIESKDAGANQEAASDAAASEDAENAGENSIDVPLRPIETIDFKVNFDGFLSKGVLCHPARKIAGETFPLVVLVHGNGPQDMDATLPQRPTAVQARRGVTPEPTRLFKTIAEGLAARGFAVARYNKRWVRGLGDFDPAFLPGQSTYAFKDDLGRVLDCVSAFDVCENSPRVLYGWSEGSAIVSALAIERSDIDAIVLQGPVAMSWKDTFRFWIENVAVPYADVPNGSNTDSPGVITPENLRAAMKGQGGVVARLGTSFFVEVTWDRKSPAPISSYLDSNSDGVLSVEDEVLPRIPEMLDVAFSPYGPLYIYADGRTLPDVGAQWADIPCPVLALQGENDASTPAFGLRALPMDSRRTALFFPGYGHTLGPAPSLILDRGAPMVAEEVLPKVAQWLRQRVGE